MPSPPRSAAWRSQRATVANLAKYYDADSTELVDARRDLGALRLEQHIEEVVASWPPLSNAQRAKLAELLAPVRAGGDPE